MTKTYTSENTKEQLQNLKHLMVLKRNHKDNIPNDAKDGIEDAMLELISEGKVLCMVDEEGIKFLTV